MPRRKLSTEEAVARGGYFRNPSRYKDDPVQSDAANPFLRNCAPPNDLSSEELLKFQTAASDWWWLRKSDMQLVRIYVRLAAAFDRDELNGAQLAQLIKVTINLGGTPSHRISESAADGTEDGHRLGLD